MERKVELVRVLSKKVILSTAMGILFGLVLIFFPSETCESLIQVLGLLFVLVFPIKNQTLAKDVLKVNVSSSLVYSLVSNYFNWVLNPSSDVQETTSIITFLFFNNAIFLLGVSISLLVFVYKLILK